MSTKDTKKALDLNSVDVLWRNINDKFLRKDDMSVRAEAEAAEEPEVTVDYEKGSMAFSFKLPRGLQGEPGPAGIGLPGLTEERIFILGTEDSPTIPVWTSDISKEEWNEMGYVPRGWYNTPLTPILNTPCCWMAVRTQPSSSDINEFHGALLADGSYSTRAVLFSSLGKQGPVSDFKTYIFKLSDTQPTPPSTGIHYTEIDGWEDYPTNESGQWWQCIGSVDGPTGIVKEWSVALRVNPRDGRGIDSISEEYAINNSDTTIPTEWASGRISPTEDLPYLWNREIITYNDGSSIYTTPVIIAWYVKDGADGKGINSITEYYLINDGNNVPSKEDDDWTQDKISPSDDLPYLWNMEVITYSDGSEDSFINILAIKGTDGKDGQYTEMRFAVGTNEPPIDKTQRIPDGWVLKTPFKDVGEFVYMITTTIYPDGRFDEWSDPVQISGERGEPGLSGESAYHIELSNEFDQILTDRFYKVSEDQSFTIIVDLFKGTEKLNIDSDINLSSPIDIDYSVDGNTIEFTIKKDVDLSQYKTLNINLTFKKDGEYDFLKTFKLARVNSTIDYDLRVTPTYIKKDTDGNSLQDRVECKISRKIIGRDSSIEELNYVPEGLNLKIYADSEDNIIEDLGQEDTIPSTPITSFTKYLKYELYDTLLNILLDTVIVEVLSDGKQGEQGEPGLPGAAGAGGSLLYPAGEYKDDIYYINDGNSAPYVLYMEDYYILSKVTPTEGIIGILPTDTNYWTKTNKFEAVYTKVGVIDHGLVGSAVFYGDWMFSQYGYDKDGNALQDENSYKKFGQDVDGNIMTELNVDTLYGTSSAFKPMTALNFKDGSGAFAGGQISWDLNGNLILPPTGSLSTYYKTDFNNETQTLYCSLSISSGNAYGREVDAHLKLYKLDKTDGFNPTTDPYYKTLALGGSTGNGKIKPPYSTTLTLGVNDGEESDMPTHVALFVNGIVLAIGVVREEEEYITVYWELSNSYENTSFNALVYNYNTDLYRMNDDTGQEESVDYKYIKYITDSVGSTNFKWREIDDFDYCIISSEGYGHKSKGVWYVNGSMLYNNHESVPGKYGIDGDPYPYNGNKLICENDGYYYYDKDGNKVEVSSLAESMVYNPSYSPIDTFNISSLESPRTVSIERKYWRDETGNTIRIKNNSIYYAYFEFGSSQNDIITDGTQSNGADYSVVNEYGNPDTFYSDKFMLLEPGQTLTITRNSNALNYELEDLYITLGNEPGGNNRINSDPSAGWVVDESFSLSYEDKTLNLQMNNTGYFKNSNGGQQNVSSGGDSLSKPGYINLEDLYAIGKTIIIS